MDSSTGNTITTNAGAPQAEKAGLRAHEQEEVEVQGEEGGESQHANEYFRQKLHQILNIPVFGWPQLTWCYKRKKQILRQMRAHIAALRHYTDVNVINQLNA